jgi:multidrug transporter EmrE-like cation transporter
MYGLLSGLCFSAAGLLQIDLTKRLGIQVTGTMMPICLLSWLYYHIHNSITKLENDGDSLLVYRHSPSLSPSLIRPFEEDDQFEKVRLEKPGLSIVKMSMVVVRSVISQLVMVEIYLCYYFASLISVSINQGLLTSLFSSSIVFTTLFFYLFFQQTPSPPTLFGMVLVILCIFIIAFSG